MKFSNLTEKDAEELVYFGYVIGEKVGQGTYSKVYKATFECKPVTITRDDKGKMGVALKNVEFTILRYQPTITPATALSRSRSSSVRYSTAFLADMRVPKPQLACKVVEKSYKMPKDYPHRFMQRELNIMTKLKHPYVPRLHSILRKGDKFMIFMTYTARGNLCDYIINHGPVKEPVAQRWIRQITLALIYLHTLDIAHRDISCDNVLLTKGWNVKLCDYGYACFNVTYHGWPKYSHTNCGSMPYVAPEIIRGVPYNPKYSDIWSLGVVLFVMVNGTFPFTANSYEIQYNDQMEQNYGFRRCLTISPATVKKIKAMLEPNPLLRISLQEIMDSNWLKETNSKVSQSIRDLEIAAQLEAESIKEYMKLNHDKKLSIQYPVIRIEKESFGHRLANLMKRYRYKVRCKGHHEEDLHYHFRAKKFLQASETQLSSSVDSRASRGDSHSRLRISRSPSSTSVAERWETRSGTSQPVLRSPPSVGHLEPSPRRNSQPPEQDSNVTDTPAEKGNPGSGWCSIS